MKMTSFETFFRNSKGKPIEYKGKVLVLADKFPIANGDKLIISIESTNSKYRQGFSIDVTGKCEYMGNMYEKGKGINMLFWENTLPKQAELTVFTKEGFVWIVNFWEETNHLGTKSRHKGHNGAAMIIEEIENGKRYRCNDGHPDEDFDDIIFTVQRLKSS